MKAMKFLTNLCVFIAMVALAASCVDEVKTGIDVSTVPPKDVTYDETNSTSTSLGFYWEVDDAIKAGAVSFTAQIIQDEEIGGDGYTGKTSQTFQATSRPNDGAIFNGLTENAKYYARVRANYPRSIYSEWIYVKGSDGKPAVIKLGTGVVEETLQTISGASARCIDVSANTAVVQWSLSDFADLAVDVKYPASIELYDDESCSNLKVSWDITDVALFNSYQPAFIFSGLEPSKDYWFVVEIIVPAEVEGDEPTRYRSEAINFTTAESKAVKMASYASPGETILYQDFGELIWGGDVVNRALGYSAEKRSSATELKQARGWNPVGGDLGYYICTASTEMGIYNSIGKAIKGSNASLADWAELREDMAVVGMLCGRPGALKVGASSRVGAVVTPELSGLTETATVEVSFKAAPYGSNLENLDPLGTYISILGGASVKDNIVQSTTTNNIVKSFNLVNDLAMHEYCFEIPNVSPSSRIAIGAKRNQGESGQHRFTIDDICIKVVKYGKTAVTVETPAISLAADEGLVMATWQACENASSYDVEYKKTSETDWTYAGNTTYTTMTIEGLYQNTSYDVRVMAKYSDEYKSGWSQTKSITTPYVTAKVTAYVQFATASQIGFKWYTDMDFAQDINTPYTLQLYEGEACEDAALVVQLILDAKGLPSSQMTTTFASEELWTATTGPGFLFSGLKSNTVYTLKVTNRQLQIAAEVSQATESSNLVEIPSTAAPERSVILFEDFNEILWGGTPRLEEFGWGLPGYSSDKRGSLNSFVPLAGLQPLSNSNHKLYLVKPTTQFGLFNTTKNAVANTRLKHWGAISENYDGNASGSLCGMAGMIKLGAANSYVQIMTPELTCLSGNAKIRVSFDMCPYTDDGAKIGDPLDAVVKVMTGVKLGTNGTMTQSMVSGKVAQEKTFTINQVLSMTPYEFELDNVAPGSRIAIGTYRPSGASSGNRRAFMDNVKIEVISYNK